MIRGSINIKFIEQKGGYHIRPDGTKTTLIESFQCALRGIYLTLHERNMRIHCVAAFIAIAMGFFFRINNVEWCLLLIVIERIFSREIINSENEDSFDLNYPDYNPKVRDAKDKFAGAVLSPAILALIVGAIIFVPKIMALYI